ncbi:MAG: hypothetical protein GX633_04870, partial [Clostridiales bacterium]|nr:hypothetical protein [Clostridiales bacterium]
MYNVYPVVKRAEVCLDYEVYINGKRYDTDTARVSAMPFNRRWPGHQRSKSQTELISFVSLETDEKLSFDIVPKGDSDDVIIRPASLGIKPEIRDGHVLFTLSKPAYFTVEAFGRNRALHIFADPIEVCNVDKSDENVIYYGPGEHFEEIIELHDNETLYLERGSVVYGCIRAKDAKNISILGRGILDNSLNVEKILYEANVQNN